MSNSVRELELTREEFVNAVCDRIDKMKELFIAKNQQYATADPFANFRSYAAFRSGSDDLEACFEVGRDYCGKHLAKLLSSQLSDPKLQESCMDIAVYNLIFSVMADKVQGRQNESMKKEINFHQIPDICEPITTQDFLNQPEAHEALQAMARQIQADGNEKLNQIIQNYESYKYEGESFQDYVNRYY